MNSLSWMIYFADMARSCDFALSLTMIACAISLIAAGIIWIVNDYGDAEDKERRRKAIVMSVLIGKIAAGTLLVDIVIPSSSTIYAIAASEMGEQVLKSPTVTKAQAALDAWLDKQIGEQKVEQK